MNATQAKAPKMINNKPEAPKMINNKPADLESLFAAYDRGEIPECTRYALAAYFDVYTFEIPIELADELFERICASEE